jgi:uncharacterized protein (TIGR02117 family)
LPSGGRWRGALALVAVFLLVVGLATARGGNPFLYPAKPGEGVAVYVVDNGFHTNIAVPAGAIAARGGALADAAAQTTSAPWVMIGWGDARFYEDQSPWQGRLPDGARALLGGRPTFVHLQGVAVQPDRAWTEGVHRLILSRAGLAALLARADRSLKRGRDGAPIMEDVAHPPAEAYFRSVEDFSLIHLCNHWTAELLDAAGAPTTPVLDTIPAGLWLDLKLRAGL